MANVISAWLGKGTVSRLLRVLPAVLFLVAGVSLLPSANATGETRALKIYHVHTGERAVITFKKDGKYLPDGLKQLDYILRDWRRDEPTKMDPHLFDLLWEVYQKSGSDGYIYVVCGYRAPETNAMLRSRSRGVAKASQHILGKAIDFFIPGVPLAKLRAIGLKLGAGGVGYYPTSGSPFVHMDVGSPRYWPRMNRDDLLALFPNGRTMYIPSDGKPLPGYEAAVAAYKSRKANGGSIQIATASPAKKHSFLGRLLGLGGGADEADDTADNDIIAPQQVASASTGASGTEAVGSILLPAVAPVTPVPRPAIETGEDYDPATARVPAAVEETAAPNEASVPDRGQAEPAVLALAVPVPAPRPGHAVVVATSTPSVVTALVPQRDDPTAMLIRTALATETQGVQPGNGAQFGAGITGTVPMAKPAAPDGGKAQRGVIKLASLSPVSSPRSTLMAAGADVDPLVAIRTGVRTTAKAARLSPADAGFGPDADIIPPARRAISKRMLSDSMVIKVAYLRPRRFDNAMLVAPTVVYAAGFQHRMPGNAPDAFTGSAVTFFALAKFASLD